MSIRPDPRATLMAQETWLDPEEMAYDWPLWKSPRRGVALDAAGVRVGLRLGIPDTFFTIPAVTTKRIRGWVNVEEGALRFWANRLQHASRFHAENP